MGPGSPNTHFPGARANHFGREPGGYWLIEPTTGPKVSDPLAAGPLPLVLVLPDCCLSGDVAASLAQDAFWRHIAQQGAVVILPVYNAASVIDDVRASMREALSELTEGDHPAVDLTKSAVIGYAFGGPAAIIYAATAEAEGLPIPSALLVANPCEGNAEGNSEGSDCVTIPTDLALPRGVKVVIWVADQDGVVGTAPAKRIWTSLDSVSLADRDFVMAVSDDHGHLPFIADHNTINAHASDPGGVYGLWKLFDGLTACTFTGDFCQYALGDTPEQRFMGVWSDGVPVAELKITDNPGPPRNPPGIH